MTIKSGGVVLALSFFLLLPLVAAADGNNTEEFKINQAYSCLQNGINNKTTSTLSLQEAVFGILALGNNERAVKKLESENRSISANQTCWPRASCTIKETAQALLAYRALGRSTTSIENWLSSKSGATTGLNWFLEIDIENHVPATCHVRYGSTDRTVTIGTDMRLTGDLSGTCLSIVPTGYWLEITSTCLDRSYEVSCDRDFLTTLLYKQSSSDAIFVSPTTQSKPASGTTNESISSRCFKSGSSAECDYEGTLWAALALDAAGVKTSSYVPYLAAFATAGERYLPSAFLYKLTGGQDHYTSLIQEQHTNQFWEAPSSAYRKFYDTALALWSLQGATTPESANAKSYLLDVQGSSGCWDNNNLRSTAFLLYAGWPEFARNAGGTTLPPGNGTTIESCVDASPSYACVDSLLQCIDAGGEELRNYDCQGSLFCCSVVPQLATCAEFSGQVCDLKEECQGTPRDSADGQCCTGGSCVPITTPTTTECQDQGGTCTTSTCANGEHEEQFACSEFSELCCIPDTATTGGGSSSGSSTLWIVLLVLLIVLVVLAIIFRRRLQMMFFKGRRPEQPTGSSPILIRRPPFPPSSSARGPSYGARPQPAPSTRKPVSQVDKEMEETLRKLREMSK